MSSSLRLLYPWGVVQPLGYTTKHLRVCCPKSMNLESLGAEVAQFQ